MTRTDTTHARRNADLRERKLAAGLVRREFWVPASIADDVTETVKQMIKDATE